MYWTSFPQISRISGKKITDGRYDLQGKLLVTNSGGESAKICIPHFWSLNLAFRNWLEDHNSDWHVNIGDDPLPLLVGGHHRVAKSSTSLNWLG